MQSHSAGAVLPDLSGLGDAALLAHLDAALAQLRCRVLDATVDDVALGESLRRLQRVESAVHGEKLRRLHELAERESFRADAERCAADWAAAQLGLSQRDAQQQTRTAAALDRLPDTAEALAAGEITAGHAVAAARGLAVLDRDGVIREQQAGGDVDAWTQAVEHNKQTAAAYDAMAAAVARESDPRAFGREVEAWTQAHAPGGVESREQRAAARRGHWWDEHPDDDGLFGYRGKATAADKAQLTAALGPLARKTSADDDRTVGQRNLDAFVELARRACDAGDLPSVAAQRPHVTVIRDERAGASTPEWVDGVGPVSSATAELFACDADTTVFTVDPTTGNWDVGHADGDPSPKQRKAVIARDRACVGCGADAARCQLHHIIWRSKRGKTVIANLVLVCWSCHHGLHHLGWTISKDGSGGYRIAKHRAA